MKDGTDQDNQQKRRLMGAVAWQRKPAEPEPIGQTVERFLSGRKDQFIRAQFVLQALEELLPQAVQQYCTAAGFISGVLTIEVAAGPYLHQMEMMKHELLEEIKKQCPRSGIREIRILPGWTKNEKVYP